MIELKEEQVEALLEKTIESLKDDDDFQLVSITKKIKNYDALSFFEAAKYIGKNRMFWMSSEEDFYLVGIGQAYEIMAEESRFKETKERWYRLLEKATIHNPYEQPGTGIVALGGLSFDPQKPTTPLWEKFKPSHFTIPEFLITKQNKQCYVTMNVLVRKNDHPHQLANEWKDLEERLFEKTTIEKQTLTIKEKIEIEPTEWKDTVRKATEEINDSDIEKIVLAREMFLRFNENANIGSILQKLLDAHPNSYVFAIEKDNHCFLGATPERLVKIEKDHLLSTCLAGTAPRGKTKEEDQAISEGLLHDQKNREEHDFVVKMIKNAMEDYCTHLDVPNEPIVYPLTNLQHLYTPVTATLKKGYSIFDIMEKLHPTPALGGTPKESSLRFIRNHERLDRGWYGAPIGWIDSNQNGEFAVAIRSALIKGTEASLFAGCGVVKDSNPDEEYEETNIKFLPMLSVLGG
ncbi:isochorismate synthase MenF [Oceanobacillus sp. Castelsardo]|uniref:isochorismate synthase n=1 Tax=Oceanobacillus sp. Castelsardo TaxID=1851204 RepID=UPI000839221F|nr:isochorismate synthase [Oceanobacillus sp. Castelsardo]